MKLDETIKSILNDYECPFFGFNEKDEWILCQGKLKGVPLNQFPNEFLIRMVETISGESCNKRTLLNLELIKLELMDYTPDEVEILRDIII